MLSLLRPVSRTAVVAAPSLRASAVSLKSVNVNAARCMANFPSVWGDTEEDKIIPDLQRTGLLGMKCGMIQDWDKWGRRIPLTVLQVHDLVVVKVLTEEVDGYSAVQVGFEHRKEKHTNKPMQGYFDKCGVTPRRHLREFRVSPENALPPGTHLSVMHFSPGQFVDVSGTSAGKGFAGVMKKWGFGGQSASHGVSKAHRSLGSTGQHTDPGRVFKGKKMPGRMGANRVTVQSLQVHKLDPERGLLYLRGHVPGKRGGVIEVRDSCKKIVPLSYVERIPVPTWDASLPYPTGDDLVAPVAEKDPFGY